MVREYDAQESDSLHHPTRHSSASHLISPAHRDVKCGTRQRCFQNAMANSPHSLQYSDPCFSLTLLLNLFQECDCSCRQVDALGEREWGINDLKREGGCSQHQKSRQRRPGIRLLIRSPCCCLSASDSIMCKTSYSSLKSLYGCSITYSFSAPYLNMVID